MNGDVHGYVAGGFSSATDADTLMDEKTQPIGQQIKFGEDAVVEIIQIGKECHQKCAIFYRTGDCIVPREGVFVKILKGGIIKLGDKIERVVNYNRQLNG